jgi:N-acetylneuraminic acid mutarotase
MHYQSVLILVISILFSNQCSAQKKLLVENNRSNNKIAVLENARAAHMATRLADGTVLIVGGMQRNGVFYDEVEVFDADINAFVKLKNKTNKKIVSHTATFLKDGRVLIAGGWSNRDKPENTAEVYDAQTQRFAAVGNLKHRRSGHSATLLENGKVLIAGGSDGDGNLIAAEVFNPETNAFESAGTMQSIRNAHSATTLKDGRVLLAGGEKKRGEISSDAELYNPRTNTFTKISAKMNAVRYKHDAVLLAVGSVLIFGGSDNRDLRGRLKSAEIYNPEKEFFSFTNDMNAARFKISETGILLKDGKVLIAGGSEAAEIFNPQTKSFSPVAGSFGRSLHYSSVTLLKDERVLILGGYEFVRSGEPTSTNQAWIFEI